MLEKETVFSWPESGENTPNEVFEEDDVSSLSKYLINDSKNK